MCFLIIKTTAEPGRLLKALDVTLPYVDIILAEIQVEGIRLSTIRCWIWRSAWLAFVVMKTSCGRESATNDWTGLILPGKQYCGHWLLDHVGSVHVALVNFRVAVKFVAGDTSRQRPEARQAALLLQHMVIPSRGSWQGTSSLIEPLG